MASIFRIGFSRVATGNGAKSLLTVKSVENIRYISGKSLKVTEKSKPAPWNYKEKSYNILKYFYDKTTARFDENTKVLVVEGPVAANKSKFAKELAQELDMMYFPEANLDMVYVNEYGYDLKQLDSQIPESCRSFDVNNFLLNPKHRLSASFQLKQYAVKFSQYIDGLAHLLSTGQGVVLDRCVYSDFVFAEAMHKMGYISSGALSVYYDLRKNSINELLRPHLVIYLDVPVPKILENVKSRNIGYEVTSPAMNPEYLSHMERAYKQGYLKEISKHSELLIYDWSNGGDTEVVVEDIERINFDFYDHQDPKMKDWDISMEEDWGCLRNKYSDKKDSLMTYLNVPRFDVPELVTDAEDMHEYREILNNAPGERFEKGFDASMGDTGILFKTKTEIRSTLPLRERRDQQGNFAV